MNVQQIKEVCALHGINPSKKFGQNFVIDANVIRMMVEHANVNANDHVVEVGPGLGALTSELAKRVKKVVAVEVDKRMYGAAREILAPYKNVEIVHEDILEISNQHLVEIFHNPSQPPLTLRGGDDRDPPLKVRGGEPPPQRGEGGVMRTYKLVANLPYSITSAVLRKFTEEEPRPSLIVVMVQKEVAQRVCAKPGEMSVLSVAVQYYGKPEIVKIVPRSAFWPQPEVDSAILRIAITPSPSPPYLKGEKIGIDDAHFFKVVRAGFANRRKQLQNNLAVGFGISKEEAQTRLQKLGFDPKVRAQELSVAEWIALTAAL